MENSAAKTLYDLLVTRDFEPEILDSQGKAITNPEEAELFSFDWKTPEKNYGTVVVLLGADNDLQVYFGDNLGRGMEGEDKRAWYDFLAQMKSFATRNLLKFGVQDLSRLKYAMQGMAAIKEGLFEGYYGTRKISYSDQPKKTRLMIRHNRDLGEGEARYRAIESLFVETADGERFRVPSRSLTHGRMLARHIAEGGTPYDAFGQHITGMVQEMATLAKFIRAARNRKFDGAAADMTETAVRHYADIKRRAKHMISQRGYREERDQFDPAAITDTEQMVSEIRDLFVEQSLDQRIEEALPILARLALPVLNNVVGAASSDEEMKEAEEFESWTDQIVEGTWALPDTPEKQRRLQDLMSQELTVGPDAINATEQLYDLVGDDALFDILDDISNLDPDANAWADPRVQQRMAELGVQLPQQDTSPTEELPGQTPRPEQEPISESDRTVRFEPVRVKGAPSEGDIHHVNNANLDLLPGFRDNSTGEDYSDTYYYRDPISGGVFSVYTHGGAMRVRGTGGMREERVREIQQTLERDVQEDLDTDGVMMTRPSNMSSESRKNDAVNRLIELARI
jgi:hypothetical protein